MPWPRDRRGVAAFEVASVRGPGGAPGTDTRSAQTIVTIFRTVSFYLRDRDLACIATDLECALGRLVSFLDHGFPSVIRGYEGRSAAFVAISGTKIRIVTHCEGYAYGADSLSRGTLFETWLHEAGSARCDGVSEIGAGRFATYSIWDVPTFWGFDPDLPSRRADVAQVAEVTSTTWKMGSPEIVASARPLPSYDLPRSLSHTENSVITVCLGCFWQAFRGRVGFGRLARVARTGLLYTCTAAC